MKVMIAGGSGQIGNFLTRLLTTNGFQVVVIGRSFFPEFDSYGGFKFEQINEYSVKEIRKLILRYSPEYFINLASMSSVKSCDEDPILSAQINSEFPISLLSSLSKGELGKLHFIQASSSEMFSQHSNIEINEDTPISPGSIYGQHKAEVHSAILELQKNSGLNCSSLILFNNESYLRPVTFASRKIINSLIDMVVSGNLEIRLGRTDITRDWNHPNDTSRAILEIIKNHMTGNFVIGSGNLYSLRDFLNIAASFLEINSQKLRIVEDPSFFRKKDNSGLKANSTKLRSETNWLPEYSFEGIIREMVDHELQLRKKNFYRGN